ncbi:xanthine dehydrogenase family protein molybdopterin-binding subunit [Rubrimonas sp.]|uniref:xanthine dehydrogenase family protein molybdopterin-binding subunit n=1 Tax=Rubrimonas sp. TaxID=2036015 RepID=UPI002FDE323D
MLHRILSDKTASSALRIARVDRRAFLKGASGFALAAYALPASAFDRWPVGGEDMSNGLRTDPLIFVAIDPDGTVTLVAHRAEMGQGSRTSLPMVLADEMGADWARVRIVQAPGDEPLYGNQDTDGSRSMRHHIQAMRQMGAAVRQMLAEAAAERWGVAPEAVRVGVHEVADTVGGATLGFGELAEAAMARPVPAFEALSFKSEDEFRYIGKEVVRIVDLHDITTGKAIYGADVAVEGMLVAAIARPPVVGGRVARFDATAALAIQGVVAVETLDPPPPGPVAFMPLGGVAVLAENTWAAIRGRDALTVEWEDGPNAVYDSAAFRAEMEATAAAPARIIRDRGDVEAAKAQAANVISATYHQAHMSHAPMEPPAALARVEGGKAEIWAPVQSPYGTRQAVAGALGLPEADVTVNQTLLGGGFGRKSKCDFAIEAALLSAKAGRPVRVQWTREDDIRHSFHHTTSVERIEAAVDGAGKVTGWLHRAVAPTIMSTFMPDPEHSATWEAGMGQVDNPFDVPNLRCESGPAKSHTRVGWFRAVSNIPHAFAIQSFAAELAHELGRDQREMLLELIGPARKVDLAAEGFPEDFWNYGENWDHFAIDTGRLANVLMLASDAAGWGRDLPEGEGLGLAVHRSFVTYVAACARVKVENGRIRVPEIHMAVDCGFAANPERIRSQMEGAAVMGMTLTLHSGVSFEKGRVVQSNFNDYPMARATNFPEKVHVEIVKHPFSVPAAGVGEPGLPPIAPAICNALFNATGKRMRSLPIGETIDA